MSSPASKPLRTKSQDSHPVFVIRLKGSANLSGEVKDTLMKLRLLRVFSACLIPMGPQYDGMLKVVKDVTCWGQVEKDRLKSLLSKRGRLVGDRRLTDENLSKFTTVDSLDSLTEDLYICRLEMADVKGLKPFFRLSPPRRGFGRTKKQGVRGDIGKDINDLIKRMI